MFDENQTSQAVNIGIVKDDKDESDEDFYLILSKESSVDSVKEVTVTLDFGSIAKVTIGKSLWWFSMAFPKQNFQ